jgi:LPXTG-motif cell wall-anchored protein
MRYKSKSVFVYDDNGKSLREGTDYTLEFGEYGGFNIYFNYDNIESYGSEVIYITYDVVLTENTRTDSTYKNFNGASLCYSNLDGYYDCITSVVYVTTYGLIVHKYDNDTGDSLAGAEFAIYDNEKCEGDPIGTITTDSNGYGGYTGLAAGTYYVVETNAPSGYKIDSTPHQVSVNAKNYYYSGHYAYTTATEYTSDINESLYGVQAIDDSGYLLWFNPNDTTQVVTNTNNKTYIPAYVKSVSTVVDQTDDNGWYYGDSCTVLEVPNVAGRTLPTTGGIGVVPFIALGSVLMIGAVIILVTRKRMNGEQDID